MNIVHLYNYTVLIRKKVIPWITSIRACINSAAHEQGSPTVDLILQIKLILNIMNSVKNQFH